MANLKGCFSHKSDDWATPFWLYDWFVNKCGYFDPCPLGGGEVDALLSDWGARDCFVKPPYSDILRFVRKAIAMYEQYHGKYEIVLLLPVRTDTKWFKILSDFGCDIRFIRGRLKFGGSKFVAPFPSMLVSLRPVTDLHSNSFEVTDLSFERNFRNEQVFY